MRTTQGIVSLVDSNALMPGQWTYLAATWDGTTATLFVNGTARQAALVTGYLAAAGATSTIGGGPAAGRSPFAGAVSEVAFYATALETASVSNHFAIGQIVLGSAAALSPQSSTTNSNMLP